MTESRARELASLPESQDSPESNERRRPGPGLRSRLSSLCHVVLAAGALGLLVATFMPLIHPLWPLLSVAEHFALQILLCAVLLALLALALRRWRWFALVAGIAMIQIWIIHPYWPHPALAVTPANNETRLKIVSLNVWVRGSDYQSVRDYLMASDADVIGLVEVTPRWKAELAPLAALYPFRVDCVGADERCEEMLLSKHPLINSGTTRIDNGLPVVVWGRMAPSGREPLTVAVTHLVWPLMSEGPPRSQYILPYHGRIDGLPRLAQAEQILALEAALAGFGDDLILMGDFNAAPWSRTQKYLRSNTGLDNAGFMVPSWPAWGPAPLRLPIDHILVRGQSRIISLSAGPDVGSDHLPVEAVVGLIR